MLIATLNAYGDGLSEPITGFSVVSLLSTFPWLWGKVIHRL